MGNEWPSMSYVNIPEMRHFVYKNRSIAQFCMPAFEAPYLTDTERKESGDYSNFPWNQELKRLFSNYFRMHSKIHNTSRSIKLMYTVHDTENWLAWVSSKILFFSKAVDC